MLRVTQKAQTRRQAFTLVELLVVIGIIALLISILLPSLNRAREAANQVKCMSNLRTIGEGLLLYANDYHSYLPWGEEVGGTAWGDGSHTAPQGYQLDPALQSTTYTWRSRVADELYRRASANRASDTQNVGKYGIFVCPSSPTSTNSFQDFSSYTTNPRLMPAMDRGDGYMALKYGSTSKFQQGKTYNMVPYKLSHIKHTDQLVAVFDAAVTADPKKDNGAETASADGFPLDYYAIGGSVYPGQGGTTYMTDDYSVSSPPRSGGDPISVAAGDENPGFATSDFNKDTDGNWDNIRFRHGGNKQANCLMVDGHVGSFNYSPTTHTTDLREMNINCPAPNPSWF